MVATRRSIGGLDKATRKFSRDRRNHIPVWTGHKSYMGDKCSLALRLSGLCKCFYRVFGVFLHPLRDGGTALDYGMGRREPVAVRRPSCTILCYMFIRLQVVDVLIHHFKQSVIVYACLC